MISTEEIDAAKQQASILIVEDHGYVRRTLREWLGEVFPACDILEARAGEEAVELARTHRPDIVLMDIALPGISGIEATRRIKAFAPTTRVVMLTIYDDSVHRADAAAAGVSAYVPKGSMAAELIPAISALLPSEGP